MAYVSQELKQRIAPNVKRVLKKYGVKGTLSVRNHSTLVLNISSGRLDFITNYNDTLGQQAMYFRKALTYIDVNPYHFQNHFSGRCKVFLDEIFAAMNDGNHDRSDAQVDYFDVGWYVDVKIGKWCKAYQYQPAKLNWVEAKPIPPQREQQYKVSGTGWLCVKSATGTWAPVVALTPDQIKEIRGCVN